jgi:hypothetical protein
LNREIEVSKTVIFLHEISLMGFVDRLFVPCYLSLRAIQDSRLDTSPSLEGFLEEKTDAYVMFNNVSMFDDAQAFRELIS